ncbi:MAG TPA: class I SAM-dependent methyltransferase [Trichormus sp.]|jgi:SAM-dependent methyltransferase
MTDKADLRPTERFTGLADLYAAARPSYPSQAIDFIVKRCNLNAASTVADIGCGTGIATRLLAARGVGMIGVEPNDDMRARAQNEPVPDSAAEITYTKGRGEQTGLPDAGVDAVLSAQAFHWFEADQALKEFHRILKPAGWVNLMWNERDQNDPFTTAYGATIQALRESRGAQMRFGGKAGESLLQSKLFCQAERTVFRNQQPVDEKGLIMRACSTSYSPKAGEELEQFKQQLREVFREYQKDGSVVIKYETFVFTARKLDDQA